MKTCMSEAWTIRSQQQLQIHVLRWEWYKSSCSWPQWCPNASSQVIHVAMWSTTLFLLFILDLRCRLASCWGIFQMRVTQKGVAPQSDDASLLEIDIRISPSQWFEDLQATNRLSRRHTMERHGPDTVVCSFFPDFESQARSWQASSLWSYSNTCHVKWAIRYQCMDTSRSELRVVSGTLSRQLGTDLWKLILHKVDDHQQTINFRDIS